MLGIDDVVTAGMDIAGLVSSITGANKAASASSAIAGANQQIALTEEQQDQLRAQAMEISARRQNMEILRNQQRARAMALNVATNQGAAFGSSSGLGGAYGGIGGQTATNQLGLSQSLGIGRQMFALNQNIDQQRFAIAGYQGQLASAQGQMGFGNTMMGAASSAGRLANNFLGGSLNGPVGQLGQMFGFG